MGGPRPWHKGYSSSANSLRPVWHTPHRLESAQSAPSRASLYRSQENFMGSLSIWHWLIVLVVVILVFGTKKLKNLGSDLGGAVKGSKMA